MTIFFQFPNLTFWRRNMAKDETTRLKPEALVDDTTAFQALQAIPNYQPSNPKFGVDIIKANRVVLEAERTVEVQAKSAYDAARDNAVKAEWDFHNLILGVKDQVAAQFGRDSNEYQAMGLKKKSERKAPARKKA
jgi:hypothetical protein